MPTYADSTWTQAGTQTWTETWTWPDGEVVTNSELLYKHF
jgi:hypothetical protein